mgnify:CR=1 FL=1
MNTENESYREEAAAPKASPEPVAAPSRENRVPSSASYEPLSPSDERTWAMLAHLSVLLNLVTGFLGVAAALVIYLVYKDRSRYVAYQSMQAFLFQLIFWAGGGLLIGVMWAVVGALSAVLIGLLLIPFAALLTLVFLLMPLLALVYGVVGAIQTSDRKSTRLNSSHYS